MPLHEFDSLYYIFNITMSLFDDLDDQSGHNALDILVGLSLNDE